MVEHIELNDGTRTQLHSALLASDTNLNDFVRHLIESRVLMIHSGHVREFLENPDPNSESIFRLTLQLHNLINHFCINKFAITAEAVVEALRQAFK